MKCSEEGCEKLVHSKGLCQPHYRQAKRRERGLQLPGPKPDPSKPFSRYNMSGQSHHLKQDYCINGHKYEDGTYRISSDGSRRICIICETEKHPTHCPQGHEYNEENTNSFGQCKTCNRERAPWYKIKSKYGLDMEEYKELLEQQDNKCPICFKSFDDVRPCVDHDHQCCQEEITCGNCRRKILCINCNTALGQVNDDTQILQRMIDYILEFRS